MMPALQTLQCHKAPIPEQVLRDCAKDIGRILPQLRLAQSDSHGSDLTHLVDLLQVLLFTCYDAAITSSHQTAAINVLCGIILQLASAPEEQYRDIARSEHVTRYLLDIYLDRSDGARQKSMEQLLNALIKVLTKVVADGDGGDGNRAVSRCIVDLFSIVFEGHDRVRAKCSLHALTLFLSRGLTSSSYLIDVYKQSKSVTDDYAATQDLVFHVFEWISFADVAPSIGQFVALVIRNLSAPKNEAAEHVLVDIPIWAEPLLRSIHAHFGELRDFKNQIFPGLFVQDVQSYWTFLQSLGIASYFDVQKSHAEHMSTRRWLDSEQESAVLFSALEVGKEQGVLQVTDDGRSSLDQIVLRDGTILLPASALGQLLHHASTESRLSGLTMLIISTRSTQPYTDATLAAFRRSLPHLYADTDANFRGEVVSLSQSLIYRLRDILSSLYRLCPREISTHARPSGLQQASDIPLRYTQGTHSAFVNWYISFLGSQMQPAASYQRHITSLKALRVLAQSGLDDRISIHNLAKLATKDVAWPYHTIVVTAPILRSLEDLTLDAFDDVRQCAVDILKLVHCDEGELDTKAMNHRAISMMQLSGRVDYADGSARLVGLDAYRALTGQPCVTLPSMENGLACQEPTLPAYSSLMDQILQEIEGAVDVAQTRLSAAVEQHHVHGSLTALRYTIDELQQHHRTNEAAHGLSTRFRRLLTAVTRIWQYTKPILCNDAPEGFMPDDMDDQSSLSTKDISSYAWRSIKEASLVLRASVSVIMLEVTFDDDTSALQYVRSVGDLCFDQLAELRHRGAFSTVAQTFAVVCSSIASFKDRTQPMLGDWYQGALRLILEKGSTTTRRSAGIPALLVGIANAESPAPSLTTIVEDLSKIANKKPESQLASPISQLPQVHAMNTLKVLFTQPKLAERLEAFVVPIMSIAAKELISPIWAIRNAALILFRGLIDRLLGTSEKVEEIVSSIFGVVTRLAYDRYPGLLELILELLDSYQMDLAGQDASAITVEAIFPILDILRRAPPPVAQRQHVRSLVLDAMGSTHWHVRELASRTYAASISVGELSATLETLLASGNITENGLHGRLMCARHLVTALARVGNDEKVESVVDCYTLLVSMASTLFLDVHTSSVRAAYVSCLNSIYRVILTLDVTLMQNDKFTRALTEDSLMTSHIFEGLPLKGDALQKEIELNTWLAYLANRSIKQAGPKPQSTNIRGMFFAKSDDPDTTTAVLEELDVMLARARPEVKSYFTEAVASFAYEDIAVGPACERIICGTIINAPKTTGAAKSAPLLQYLAKQNFAERFRTTLLSPSDMQRSLIMWGLAISASPNAKGGRAWLAVVRNSLTEDNEVDTRGAAIYAMLALLTCCDDVISLPLRIREQLAFALYDALNDDDSELRIVASRATRSFSARSMQDKENAVKLPPVAAQSLCTYLIKHHAGSPNLLDGAISRLTGQNLTGRGHLEPCISILRRLLEQKYELFEEEKQNLYRDDVREAEIWACVLMRLPVNETAMASIHAFVAWTMEGLVALTDQIKEQVDGPLGWTSKEAVFTLGMRVLCAANVVLSLRQKSPKVRVRGSEIRRKLRELADVGRQQALHPLWLAHVDKTLAQSVTQRVLKVATVLDRVRQAAGARS